MRGEAWVVVVGVALFVACWPVLFVAVNRRTFGRHAMFVVLAAFLVGLLGLLLIVTGTAGDTTVTY